MCKIKKIVLYLTFLSSKFIDTMFAAFVDTVQITFVDTISAVPIISSHVIAESTIVLAKYSPLSQPNVVGCQL